jgi:hypothetical protein
MSFTAKKVSDATKAILKNTTYQTNIYLWLNVALGMFPTLRNDAMYDDEGNKVTLVDITSDADVIPLDAKFVSVFADYCIGRGFQEDGNDAKQQARGESHLKLFFDMAKTI